MTTAIKKAEKELDIDTEQMKRMLKRHKEKVVSSAKTKYPVKVRSLPVSLQKSLNFLDSFNPNSSISVLLYRIFHCIFEL